MSRFSESVQGMGDIPEPTDQSVSHAAPERAACELGVRGVEFSNNVNGFGEASESDWYCRSRVTSGSLAQAARSSSRSSPPPSRAARTWDQAPEADDIHVRVDPGGNLSYPVSARAE
jgi:hypothetical protein